MRMMEIIDRAAMPGAPADAIPASVAATSTNRTCPKSR
jgi:hypothetical protein